MPRPRYLKAMEERPRYYILDDQRRVIPTDDIYAFARMFETMDRRIAFTDLTHPFSVSTVFLGIDHSFGDGPPVLFETMAFRGGEEIDCQRYCTWNEATAGHWGMVLKVKRTLSRQA